MCSNNLISQNESNCKYTSTSPSVEREWFLWMKTFAISESGRFNSNDFSTLHINTITLAFLHRTKILLQSKSPVSFYGFVQNAAIFTSRTDSCLSRTRNIEISMRSSWSIFFLVRVRVTSLFSTTKFKIYEWTPSFPNTWYYFACSICRHTDVGLFLETNITVILSRPPLSLSLPLDN